jgi:hypothetical protein
VAWSTKWLVVDAHAFAPERDRDDPTPCPSLRVRPLQRHSADASSSARDREHSVDVRDPRITPNDGSRAGRQRCVDSATTNGVCAVATRICRSRAPLEVRDQRRTRAQIVGADRLRLKRSDRRLGISATGEEWAGVHPTTRARRPAIQNNAGGTGARLTRMLPEPGASYGRTSVPRLRTADGGHGGFAARHAETAGPMRQPGNGVSAAEER